MWSNRGVVDTPLLTPDPESYLWMGKFRKDERIFPITRQAVSANIDRLIDQVGGEPPFKIGCHTFRHSFAMHLLLHGRPLKFVS